MSSPTIFYALFHSPGPRWNSGTDFRQQDGVGAHIQYMSEQLEAGNLVFGGPFLDDTGGMMILRAEDLESAQTIAAADPTVADGLLLVQVKPWLMAMESFDPK
ncbi:MAG: YciI family protein [bacterium]